VDFSSATKFKQGENLKVNPKEMHGTATTVYYIAPEVLDSNHYNEKCDIWSIGVILFMLLSGSPPFNGKDDEDIRNNIKKGEYKMDSLDWKLVSAEAKSFLEKLL